MTKRPTNDRAATSVDVANKAGVSQATVARTFSSPHMVSNTTRAKVTAAAERLGYVPNAIARSLRSQRTNIIGAVVPARGEYWQSVLTELSSQLADRSRQLLLFSFGDSDHLQQVLNSVQQYRLDGLVLASATIHHGQLAVAERGDLPLVAFNQPSAAGVVDSVSVDNEAGMAMLASHLVSLGHQRVLYVGGVASTSTDQLRYRGAASTLGANGIACPYREAGAFTYDAGYKSGAAIAAEGDLPGAIMVGSDEVALGLVDGLRSAAVKVPNDVMVTGFDGLPQASWAGYDLTTLVQPTAVLVKKAVDLLIEPAQGSRPVDLVVDGTVRFGKTTRLPTRDREASNRA